MKLVKVRISDHAHHALRRYCEEERLVSGRVMETLISIYLMKAGGLEIRKEDGSCFVCGRGARSRGKRTVSAVGWLRDRLASGPVHSTDVQRGAITAGFTWGTLLKAKRELDVVSKKRAFGAAGDWTWELPATGAPVVTQAIESIDGGVKAKI